MTDHHTAINTTEQLIQDQEPEIEQLEDQDKQTEFKPVQEQLQILKSFELFADFDDSLVLEFEQTIVLPKQAQAIFVVPRFSKVSEKYYLALIEILKIIDQTRKFYDFVSYRLNADMIKFKDKTIFKLNYQTDTDFLIFPAQLGINFANQNFQKVELTKKQFHLDPFSVATILLTHPQHVDQSSDLGIECLACMFSQYPEKYTYSLCFDCNDFDMLHFFCRNPIVATPRLGIATGFLP